MAQPRRPARRVRRSAEQARRLILEAAEKRLIEGGPEAVRVQLVARDVGMTDAAVHHHFGSRDGLLEALLRHAGRQVRERIQAAARSWTPETVDVAALSDLIAETYAQRGYARLALWLSFAGRRGKGSGMLADLADALHAIRCARARAAGRVPPRREDTLHWVALFHLVQVADPLVGDAMRRSAGLPSDEKARRRHRAWIAARLQEML